MTAAARTLLLAVVFALAPEPSAAKVTIKLATLAPDGSPWHELLKDMAASWRELSDGQVRMKIYAGGVAGDELDVLRKMRIGQLNAAAFTSLGLGGITAASRALIIPRMIRSERELDAVMRVVAPRLSERMAAKGILALGWADTGWVRFFVPRPITTVDEVRKVKLFVWSGDREAVSLWKQARFNVVPLPATEIMTGLQTGLINAFDAPASIAFLSQWWRHTPVMLDMKWAGFPGAIVVMKKTWDRVPESLRPKLESEARKTAAAMQTQARRLDDDAIKAMTKRGLKVLTPSTQELAAWDSEVEAVYPKLRGDYVEKEFFDLVKATVEEVRASGD